MKHSKALIAASLVALSGCTTWNIFRDNKLRNAVHVGADKASITREFGQPLRTTSTLNGKGVCWDYNHRLANGTIVPIYAGFRNSDNLLVAFGPNETCAQAQKDGYLNRDEEIKQRF